ncbi:hypothetical protein [Kiloniella sp. b19]|uniref:hypothetical protein n=1 Tax=Kiloniella sp. GXU_MW_B19 TaxID=3141326 RepID=UPI0031E3B5CB
MQVAQFSPLQFFNKDDKKDQNVSLRQDDTDVLQSSAETSRALPENLRHAKHILSFTDDAELAQTLSRLVHEKRIGKTEVIPGGLSSALVMDDLDCEVLLLDVAGNDTAFESIETLCQMTEARIVVLGEKNDIATYRNYLKAGASDYVFKPVDDDTLILSTLLPVQKEAPAPKAVVEQKCKLHLIIGARGGVGTTTVAVSTAWQNAHYLDQQTALIDLDVHYGSCALALDLMPERGLREALESPERIDALFVGSAMVNATDRLFVLGGEDPLDQELFFSSHAVKTLLKAVSENFQSIIMDLPRHMALSHPDLLRDADSITIVSDLTLASLRDTLRLKSWLKEQHLDAACSVVINEKNKGKTALNKAEFEKGLTDRIDFILPALEKQSVEAQASGKALSDVCGKRSVYTKHINELVQKISGQEQQKARKKWWR